MIDSIICGDYEYKLVALPEHTYRERCDREDLEKESGWLPSYVDTHVPRRIVPNVSGKLYMSNLILFRRPVQR